MPETTVQAEPTLVVTDGAADGNGGPPLQPPTSDIFGELFKMQRWVRTGLIAAGLLAWVMLGDVSDLLNRFETSSHHYGMSALTGLRFSTADLHNALAVWGANAGGASVVVSAHLAGTLIAWYQLIDVAFIVAYTLFFYWLIGRAARYRQDNAGSTTPLWTGVVAILPAGFDLVENVGSLRVAWLAYHQYGVSDGLAWLMLVVSALKWLAILAALVTAAAYFLHGLLHDDTAKPAAEAASATIIQRAATKISKSAGGQPRAPWRWLTAQLTIVIALGLFIAAPLGSTIGALDQTQDTIRALADHSIWRAFFISWAIPSLLLLCLCLWATGRLVLNDLAGPTKRPPRSGPFLVVSAVGLAGAAVIAHYVLGRQSGASLTWPLLALPAVLAAIFLASALSGTLHWNGCSHGVKVGCDICRPESEHPKRRADTVRLCAAIAVSPLAIAGFGLVRAFLDPLLLLGDASRGSGWMVGLGAASAIIAIPFGTWLIAKIEQTLLFGDEDDAKAPATEGLRKKYRRVVGSALAVAIALTTAGGIAVAGWPLGAGPAFRLVGLLTLFLSAVTLVAGLLRWLSATRSPMPLFTAMRLSRTPIIALVILAVLVGNQLNRTTTHYHHVALSDATAAASPETTLTGYFNQWLKNTATCRAMKSLSDRTPPSTEVPLLLVAAPGGGIRAAYWTGSVLDKLAAQPCEETSIFAASSVSGSSLGLAAHYSGSQSSGGQPDILSSLADQSRLAALGAAMTFRDAPAALLGLSDGWDDRARLLERAWEQADPALASTNLTALQPGPRPGAKVGDPWRPLLMLNGTEIATGCRVIVSPVHPLAAAVADSAPNCTSIHTASTTTGVAPFVPGAVDALPYGDALDCHVVDRDLRLSTAAHLSARFPFVSPPGSMYDCGTKTRLLDFDGGANENSGIASALALWNDLEPIVASHNAAVGRKETASGVPPVVVIPTFVLVDNHYNSIAPATQGSPAAITTPAALKAKGARDINAEQSVLTQQAELDFGAAVPGTDRFVSRFFLVAPYTKPSIAAPLGWTLSKMTQQELTDQLRDDTSNCATSVTSLGCLTARLGQ